MTHDTIDSLSEFLLHAGTEYRVFDLGRGLSFVDNQTFLEIENGLVACPRPRQSKAWFALSFAKATTPDNHYLWFVALPIDEQSRVISASRNHFLAHITDALQADPTLNDGLPDNPYIFTPSEIQRGQLVSELNQHFFGNTKQRSENVIAYIQAPGMIDWQKLVTQDIYCSAKVINENDNLTSNLIHNWSLLAEQFKSVLLSALDVIELNSTLQAFMLSQFQDLFHTQQSNSSLSYLQAMSSVDKHIDVQAILASLLASPNELSINSLSIIAARHYAQLTPGLLRMFFSACLIVDHKEDFDDQLFMGFYKDLVAIPALRSDCIQLLKSLREAKY